MVKLLNLILIIIVVNYFNIKKTTILPMVSMAESLKVDNSKIVSTGDNDNQPFYY